MTVFHLVRHAAYGMIDRGLGGRDPHPLTEEGRAQALRLAGLLSARPIGAVVSSPVRRARETADAVGAALGLAVVDDAAFTEIDFGAWTGASFDDLRGGAAWTRWNAFRSMAEPPGGESILKAQSRAVAGLVSLVTAEAQTEIAIVSHADIIKSILAYVLGMPMDLLRRLVIGAASVSRIELTADDARVLELNRCP